MISERAYTVIDTEQVQTALNLDYAPTGLYIDSLGDKNDESCAVEIVPPTSETRNGISVSNKLLEELFEDGAIQPKEEAL